MTLSNQMNWPGLLETPNYRLDGMRFNATDGYGVDWIVTEEVGWSDAAPVRMAVADREDTHGGVSGPVWRGPRLINLKGIAIARDRLNMLWAKERLRDCASGDPRTSYELYVVEEHMTRMTWVKHFAEVRIRDRGAVAFEWELSLRADDPFRYGETVISIPITLPTTAAGGLTLASSPGTVVFQGSGVGFTFGAPLSGGSGLAPNPGTVAVSPVLSLSGPLTNPVITNTATGELMALVTTIATGDAVVIDHARRLVTINDAPRFDVLSTTSSWWQIQPGTTEIKFSASTGPTTTPTLTVTYRPAWK